MVISVTETDLAQNELHVKTTFVCRATVGPKALFLCSRVCIDMHPCFGFRRLQPVAVQ